MTNSESRKIPYTPTERKRFEVSTDLVSRERVQNLRHAYNRVREIIPGVSFGLSLFGSLSKGKVLDPTTAASADIDLGVHVDDDDLGPELLKRSEVINDKVKDLATARRRFIVPFTGQETEEVAISDDQMQDDIVNITLRTVKETVINFLQGEGEDTDSPTTAIHVNTMLISTDPESPYSISSSLENYMWEIDQGYEPDHGSLAQFFLLDIGGGMKKYRQEFLQEIGAEGDDVANEKWRCVVRACEEFERGGEIPEAIQRQYPQTYEDARRFYGVDLQARRAASKAETESTVFQGTSQRDLAGDADILGTEEDVPLSQRRAASRAADTPQRRRQAK